MLLKFTRLYDGCQYWGKHGQETRIVDYGITDINDKGVERVIRWGVAENAKKGLMEKPMDEVI